MFNKDKGGYYLPEPSHWPIVGSIALFCAVFGAANWLHGATVGPFITFFGIGLLLYMLYGWFGDVIKENRQGLLNDAQVERSFRWGMMWFIFSEVMFFAAFFGALYYARAFSVPWLGGEGMHKITHLLLWPDFVNTWPVFHTPDPSQFLGPHSIMHTWGIPALNTLILLTSGATITVAHWALLKEDYWKGVTAQALTILLGIAFLTMQVIEYGEAYTEKALKLSSGIYGTTFFMLTGFHGFHVTVGTIMLCVILYRMIKKDFTKEHHFAFEAVAWYWHFVDVVWLGLFIFVYWL